MQVKNIESYNLPDFMLEVQKAVLEGYSVDVESNEFYPQNVGTRFWCGMVKQEGQVIPTASSEELEAPKPATRGRKPKE